MALKAKGVEYQEVHIDTGNKPDSFLALTAAGTTPVLRDGETILTESEDIVQFAEKYPGPSIQSSDASKAVGTAIFGAMKAYFLNTVWCPYFHLKTAFCVTHQHMLPGWKQRFRAMPSR
jgi:glutathione S-transferase